MAKGLEFPLVFIIGADDGLIPSTLLGEDVDREERRLFYVGMTRAKNELFLIHARVRSMYGRQFLPFAVSLHRGKSGRFFQKAIIPEKAEKQRKRDKQMDFFRTMRGKPHMILRWIASNV